MRLCLFWFVVFLVLVLGRKFCEVKLLYCVVVSEKICLLVCCLVGCVRVLVILLSIDGVMLFIIGVVSGSDEFEVWV